MYYYAQQQRVVPPPTINQYICQTIRTTIKDYGSVVAYLK